MNNEAMKEILNELFSHLERLETQNEAILQFLKEKKRVTDKQLAPYLEQAGNASNVKWRAARVRIDHLLEPEHPEEEVKLGKKPELQEAPPAEAKAEKPGEKSESATGNKEVATQGSKTSDAEAERHPMEVTQPVAEQQGAEPAAQLEPSEKGDQEAA